MRNVVTVLLCLCAVCALALGCEEEESGLSTEEVCKNLVSCGDPMYSSESACVSDLNRELKAYPKCDNELEDWVDCRLEQYCDGEVGYTCLQFKSMLESCREDQDQEADLYEELFAHGAFKKSCQKLLNCESTLYSSVADCTADVENKLAGHSMCDLSLERVYDCYVEAQCDGNTNLASECSEEISFFEHCIEFY